MIGSWKVKTDRDVSMNYSKKEKVSKADSELMEELESKFFVYSV